MRRLLAICLTVITLVGAPLVEAAPAPIHAARGRKAKKHRGGGKSPHGSKPKKEAKKTKKSERGFEL
jgi:hypothetical protein